ncbi:MAG TPA: alanine racemase [Pyrinomonadaceae bacterium]|nr:alanine racemase [Chloracidobacterium sp.]HQX56686.1 alanine racemase [Pyrinomonadaceae bacterium]MBK7804012.1 alanine racemase [Chloracidobacterium sp.]MBK9768645.1 alanine racemase [Chloracidobacterium sp.]MBL0239394.1 alanine racemase [Chloracidobacterium sp.]
MTSASEIRRPTLAITDLDALAFNYRSVRAFIGDDVRVMAVVKANAYGHGALQCSRRLETEGVEWLGVALPEEAIELRRGGIRSRILCLGGFWAGQEPALFQQNITPAISSIEQAESLNRAALDRGECINVHLKFDTGMGRIGVRWDQAAEFAKQLRPLTNLRVEALMTHFAAADDLSQNAFTGLQVARFDEIVTIFRTLGFSPHLIDLANSPAAIAHPSTRKDLVRLGGVLYGLGGDVLPKDISIPELKPVLCLTTEITHLKQVSARESLGYGRRFITQRDSLIATIPAGYADGLPRQLSGRGQVIINDRYAPIVGRISMDWTIVDVTDVEGSEIGSPVALIGRSENCVILAEDLAVVADTISYEITCGIGVRVERRFVGRSD